VIDGHVINMVCPICISAAIAANAVPIAAAAAAAAAGAAQAKKLPAFKHHSVKQAAVLKLQARLPPGKRGGGK
jgi:hypothetical protein